MKTLRSETINSANVLKTQAGRRFGARGKERLENQSHAPPDAPASPAYRAYPSDTVFCTSAQ